MAQGSRVGTCRIGAQEQRQQQRGHPVMHAQQLKVQGHEHQGQPRRGAHNALRQGGAGG